MYTVLDEIMEARFAYEAAIAYLEREQAAALEHDFMKSEEGTLCGGLLAAVSGQTEKASRKKNMRRSRKMTSTAASSKFDNESEPRDCS